MPSLLEPPAERLTYEAFMAEPTVRGRYDIVQGVRVFQPELSWQRQRIIGNFRDAFAGHQDRHNSRSVSSFDVLICRVPLQIRQPDILLISQDRLALSGGPPKAGPLKVGPELVVEIIMDGQSEQVLRDKIADYITIGVSECWVVRPDASTVEVLTLTPGGASSVAIYGEGETVQSVIFAGLAVSVTDIFED